jgi:hypothetical protein
MKLREINLDFHVFTIENENSYDQSAFVQKIDEREMAEAVVNSINVYFRLNFEETFLQIVYRFYDKFLFSMGKILIKIIIRHVNF